MSEAYRESEQRLRILLERNLTGEAERSLRIWIASVNDCADDGKTLWELLKDMDIVSPDKGYDAVIQALRAISEKKLAADVEKLGNEVIEHRKAELNSRRTSVDSADNRRSLFRTATSFEQDLHKDVLKNIGTRLKAKQIDAMKIFLNYLCPRDFPAKLKDQNISGLELIQLMEKRDIIRRGNYEKLLLVLESAQVKKFHGEINALEAQMNREISRSNSVHVEEVKNYPILQQRCQIIRLRDFIHSTYQELMEDMEFTELFLDESGKLAVSDDVELLVICTSFSTTDPSKSVDGAFPVMKHYCVDCSDSVGQDHLPVIYLVDVHCPELPPRIPLPSVSNLSAHAFVLLLFTKEKEKAEEMWKDFVIVVASSGITEPVEKVVKLWRNELQERYSNDEFSVVTISTLSGNLYLSSTRRRALTVT